MVVPVWLQIARNLAAFHCLQYSIRSNGRKPVSTYLCKNTTWTKITNYMVQIPSSEANNRCWARNFPSFMEAESSSLCSQELVAGPILCEMNPVYILTSYFFNVHVYVLLTHSPSLPSSLFPFIFPTKMLYEFLSSPCTLFAKPVSFSW